MSGEMGDLPSKGNSQLSIIFNGPISKKEITPEEIKKCSGGRWLGRTWNHIKLSWRTKTLVTPKKLEQLRGNLTPEHKVMLSWRAGESVPSEKLKQLVENMNLEQLEALQRTYQTIMDAATTQAAGDKSMPSAEKVDPISGMLVNAKAEATNRALERTNDFAEALLRNPNHKKTIKESQAFYDFEMEQNPGNTPGLEWINEENMERALEEFALAYARSRAHLYTPESADAVQDMELKDSLKHYPFPEVGADFTHPAGQPTAAGRSPQKVEDDKAAYDVGAVCDKIVHKLGISPGKAIRIVEALCKPDSGDVRFNGEKTGEGEFIFDKGPVLDALSLSADTLSTAYTEKEKKRVVEQLVGLVIREDVTCILGSATPVQTSLVQTTRRAEVENGVLRLSEKKMATSADLPKREKSVQNVANMATVQHGRKVLYFRSGKTHEAHLQEERSKTDIAARVAVSCEDNPTDDKGALKDNGLVCHEDASGNEYYTYQPVIFTMMDPDILKGIWTSKSGWKKRLLKRDKNAPVENEREYLQQMRRADAARFKGKEYIEHTVQRGDQTIVVREYPPIIQNHVFSGLSISPLNRRRARRSNWPDQLNMLRQMVQKDQFFFTGSDILEKLNDVGVKPTEKQIREIAKNIKTAYGRGRENEDQKMVLQAFHAHLTGKSINGKYSYNKKDSGADLAMMTGIQTDYLNLCLSFQCKSGNDRTIAAAAHKAAQHAYKETHKHYFNPEDSKDEKQYKQWYTEVVIKLGFANVEASRGPTTPTGKSELKIGKSPSALKYLDPVKASASGKIKGWKE